MVNQVYQISPELQDARQRIEKLIKKTNGKEYDFDERLREAQERLDEQTRRALHNNEVGYIDNTIDMFSYRISSGRWGSVLQR